MKLPAFAFVLLFVFACQSSKVFSRNYTAPAEPSTTTISFVVETDHDQGSLNDVLSACSQVKPFRSFNVNYISAEKMQVQMVFGEITSGQREEIYNQLNAVSGVRVTNISGL